MAIKTEILLPTKILQSKGLTNESYLFKKRYLIACIEKDLSKHTKLEGLCSYIILDFGKEMEGGIRIVTEWVQNASCKVRIRFGESIGEVNSSIKEKNATNDHGPRDFEYLITAYTSNLIGQTGFRFVRIDILEDKYIIFKNIVCENHILNLKTKYTYQGQDEEIKKIFEVAKRTVDLCSSSGIVWDGIKRDRLLWVGDMAPEIMALNTLYGENKITEKSLNLATKLFPLPHYMNNMFTYSLWWLNIIGDYFKDFKNEKYIRRHLKYIQGLVNQLDDVIDANGNIPSDVRALVDWPTKDTIDEDVGRVFIILLGLNSIKPVYEAFDLDMTHLNSLYQKMNKRDMTVHKMKQVIGLKYCATGMMSDEEYEILIKDGAHGFSTFMSYYILTAIASRDEQLAVKLMKEYYMGMVNIGATTFFEDFDMNWLNNCSRIDEFPTPDKTDIHGDYGKHCYIGYRHSLCHGWSSGVIKFIKEHC